MKSKLEQAFITAKSFVEDNMSREEAAGIIGRSRPWTYVVYPKIKEALEEDLDSIEDKGKHRVVREIQEWFSKDNRKQKFYEKTERSGVKICSNCGKFYSPKNAKSKKLCNKCYVEKSNKKRSD